MSEKLTDAGKSMLDDAVEAASAVPVALLETAADAAAELADLELGEIGEKMTAGAKKAHKKSKMVLVSLLLAGAAIGGYMAWSKSQKSEDETGEVDLEGGGESSAEESAPDSAEDSAPESQAPAEEQSGDESS
jgi:hypothetical protein